jgi:hypothetical protein
MRKCCFLDNRDTGITFVGKGRFETVSLTSGENMKLRTLIFAIIGFSLTCTAGAEDFRSLVAQGYRWVTVNGPYACATEQQVRQITGNPTDSEALHMVEDGGAYYLIPGKLVQVIKNDPANGMSEILLGGMTKPLWTYTRFLSASPIRGFNGVVETPETGGLIATGGVGGVNIPRQPIEDTTPTPQSSR